MPLVQNIRASQGLSKNVHMARKDARIIQFDQTIKAHGARLKLKPQARGSCLRLMLKAQVQCSTSRLQLMAQAQDSSSY